MANIISRTISYVKNRDWPWLAVGLGVSLTLQLINIGRSSFWHDESFSSVLARLGPWEIITTTANDVHPPLYYLVLHFWMRLFGTSDVAIRTLSVVCLLIAMAGLYYMVKRYISATAARWSLMLTAVGPFALRYGIEARMYAFASALIVAATWLLLNYLEDRRRWQMLLYAVTIAGLLYTHYFTFPVVIIHGIFLYWYEHGGLYPSLSRLKRWFMSKLWWFKSLAISGLLFTPWLPVAFRQFRDVEGGFWVSKETWLDPLHTIVFYQSNIASWRLDNWQLWVYVAVFAVLGTAFYSVWWRHQRSRQILWLMLGLGLLPLAIILAVSYILPSSSVYVDRYFSLYALFWYGSLGLLLWLLRDRRWLQLGLVTLLFVQFSFGIYNLSYWGNFNWDRLSHHDMDQTMELINDNYAPGDIILTTDLYIYFDAVHYNQTPATIRVIDPGKERGNASLVAGRQEVLVDSLGELEPGRQVWLLSFKQEQPEVPANWLSSSRQIDYKLSTVERFDILPGSRQEFGHSGPFRVVNTTTP